MSNIRRKTTVAVSGGGYGHTAAKPIVEQYSDNIAEVVDVIDSPDHVLYSGPQDIGLVRFVPLYSNVPDQIGKGNWAMPYRPRMESFPLTGEVVSIRSDFGQYYYTDTLNIWNGVNMNALGAHYSPGGSVDGGSVQSGIPNQTGGRATDYAPSEAFTVRELLPPTIRSAGDTVFEGRFGQSMRYTNNVDNGTAKTIFRVGTSASDGEMYEVEGADTSPVYVEWTENSAVSVNIPVMSSSGYDRLGMGDSSEFVGSQILKVSDRVTIVSREEPISILSEGNLIGATSKNILLHASNSMQINVDKSYFSTVGESVTFDTPNIYLGSPDATEPVVLGDSAASLLNDLLDALINIVHMSGSGATKISPTSMVELQRIKARLPSILSERNYTM